MGFNTTVVVMNDAIHSIAKDPHFGLKLADAVLKLQLGKGKVDIEAGGHVNAATAIESHHADFFQAVLVGGNCGEHVCGVSIGWRAEDKELELLKGLAYKLGYKLSKAKTKG